MSRTVARGLFPRMDGAAVVTTGLFALLLVPGVGGAQTPPPVTGNPPPASPITSTSPETTPPTMPVAPALPNASSQSGPAAGQATGSAAGLPLSPGGALSAALQQVSSLQQARIDEAIAAEDLRQARAALLPRARSATAITYNSPAHRGVADPSFIAQNAIHEYQELLGVTGDLSFGVASAIRRSRALLEAARSGTEIARRALARGVDESYFGAALGTAKRKAADESLAAAVEFERVTELNYRAGEVPEVDWIRARLQTAARRDDLAQAREAETLANAALSTILGYDVARVASIESLPQTADRNELDAFTRSGVERRPELAQLDAQLRAARADIGVARADVLPRITYSVDEGFDTSSLAPDVLRQHRGVLATANIDVPIFDWGATRSRQKQAQLRAEGAQLQRQLTLRDLYLQFATARVEATTAADRVENARRAVADAERNVAISIDRYRAGEAPISEATDAQTTLATQRLALQQALFDYQIARAHLREAGGA
jgi:outer membrane protein